MRCTPIGFHLCGRKGSRTEAYRRMHPAAAYAFSSQTNSSSSNLRLVALATADCAGQFSWQGTPLRKSETSGREGARAGFDTWVEVHQPRSAESLAARGIQGRQGAASKLPTPSCLQDEADREPCGGRARTNRDYKKRRLTNAPTEALNASQQRVGPDMTNGAAGSDEENAYENVILYTPSGRSYDRQDAGHETEVPSTVGRRPYVFSSAEGKARNKNNTQDMRMLGVKTQRQQQQQHGQ